METATRDNNADDRITSNIGAASFLIPARKDQSELLDQNMGTMGDVRANLMEMWRINRYFGGIEALTSHLYPLLRQYQSLTSRRYWDWLWRNGSTPDALGEAEWPSYSDLRFR